MLTTHGKLEVHRVELDSGMYEYQLTLDGKVTDVENKHGVDIVASYPEKGPARIVLLELYTGGSGCPASFKVIEVKNDGSAVRSEEFGNCSPVVRTSFTNGALHINIPKIKWVEAESWLYQNGKLSKVKSTSSK